MLPCPKTGCDRYRCRHDPRRRWAVEPADVLDTLVTEVDLEHQDVIKDVINTPVYTADERSRQLQRLAADIKSAYDPPKETVAQQLYAAMFSALDIPLPAVQRLGLAEPSEPPPNSQANGDVNGACPICLKVATDIGDSPSERTLHIRRCVNGTIGLKYMDAFDAARGNDKKCPLCDDGPFDTAADMSRHSVGHRSKSRHNLVDGKECGHA